MIKEKKDKQYTGEQYKIGNCEVTKVECGDIKVYELKLSIEIEHCEVEAFYSNIFNMVLFDKWFNNNIKSDLLKLFESNTTYDLLPEMKEKFDSLTLAFMIDFADKVIKKNKGDAK